MHAVTQVRVNISPDGPSTITVSAITPTYTLYIPVCHPNVTVADNLDDATARRIPYPLSPRAE